MVGSVGYRDSKGRTKALALDSDAVDIEADLHIASQWPVLTTYANIRSFGERRQLAYCTPWLCLSYSNLPKLG